MKPLFTKISPVVLEMGRRLKEGDNANISLFEDKHKHYYLHFGDKKFMIDMSCDHCTEEWMTKEEMKYLCKCAAPIIDKMNDQVRVNMEAHWNEILFGEKK